MQAMGELVCVDVLFNNWDRLPAVWSNEGNPRNIFLTESMFPSSVLSFFLIHSLIVDPKSLVVAIDSMCMCPKAQFVPVYLEKVKLFLRDAVHSGVDQQPPIFHEGKTNIIT